MEGLSIYEGRNAVSTDVAILCRGPDLNRHGPCGPQDFKSCASTSSATPACLPHRLMRRPDEFSGLDVYRASRCRPGLQEFQPLNEPPDEILS